MRGESVPFCEIQRASYQCQECRSMLWEGCEHGLTRVKIEFGFSSDVDLISCALARSLCQVQCASQTSLFLSDKIWMERASIIASFAMNASFVVARPFRIFRNLLLTDLCSDFWMARLEREFQMLNFLRLSSLPRNY